MKQVNRHKINLIIGGVIFVSILLFPEIKREEVNKLLQEKVSGYIQENEGKFIFVPLMNDTDSIDWETTDNFEFSFKIALKPEVSLDFKELGALESRSLQVTDENLDAELERLRIQHGISTQHDTVEELDNLAVVLNIQELDEEENDLSEGYSQMVKFLLNKIPEPLKKEILGKVKDESFNLKLADVLTKEEMVEHLSVSDEMAADLNGLFRLNVKGCLTLEPAELNEEFFSKAFYDDSINSLEKAKERITESLNGFYEDKNLRFLQDEVKRILMDKTSVELSVGFLNEFFARNAELKEEDSYEEELARFKEQTKWDLILDALAASEEQSVDEKEVKEQLKMVVLQQYGQMGSQLTLKAPNAKLRKVDDDAPLFERVDYFLKAEVNPQLAGHGGECTLMEITDDGYAVLQFGGGCNGCSQIDVTVKDGIEKQLIDIMGDEIKGVKDMTEHERGEHSYY